jgi:RNA polymerase sigma factor
MFRGGDCMDLADQLSTSRNDFIEESKSFIYSVACKVCRRKLNWANDDELSIALIAFNKACDTYSDNKGNFYSYGRALIKNALIDFFRKAGNVPYLMFESDSEEMEYVEYKSSITSYEKQIENSMRAEEIVLFSKELEKYGLNFSLLLNSSPSHKDTRNTLLNIAFVCINEETILSSIKAKGNLPVKEIMLLTGNNRKLIEKWRRYILVLILILSSSDYPYIKSFLNIRVGERDE